MASNVSAPTELEQLSAKWKEIRPDVVNIVKEASTTIQGNAETVQRKRKIDNVEGVAKSPNESAKLEFVTIIQFKKDIEALVGNRITDFDIVAGNDESFVGTSKVIGCSTLYSHLEPHLQAIFNPKARYPVDRINPDKDEPAYMTPWSAKVVLKDDAAGAHIMQFLGSAKLHFICPIGAGNPTGEIVKGKDGMEIFFNGETFSQCCRELGIFRRAFLTLKFEIPWRILLERLIDSAVPFIHLSKSLSVEEQRQMGSLKRSLQTAGSGKARIDVGNEAGAFSATYYIKIDKFRLLSQLPGSGGAPTNHRVLLKEVPSSVVQMGLIALVSGKPPASHNPSELFALYDWVQKDNQKQLDLRLLEAFCEAKTIHTIVSSNEWSEQNGSQWSVLCRDVVAALNAETGGIQSASPDTTSKQQALDSQSVPLQCAPDANYEQIMVCVRVGYGGDDLRIKVNPNDYNAIRKIKEVAGRHWEVSANVFNLFFEHELLWEDMSLAYYGIKSGDVIEAYEKQSGC